jgi:hypothetical protein
VLGKFFAITLREVGEFDPVVANRCDLAGKAFHVIVGHQHYEGTINFELSDSGISLPQITHSV